MEEETKLEKYGTLYSSMLSEGDGYYFYGYASEDDFDFDEDLKVKFQAASKSLEIFKESLEDKIIKEGGDPADYEI